MLGTFSLLRVLTFLIKTAPRKHIAHSILVFRQI